MKKRSQRPSNKLRGNSTLITLLRRYRNHHGLPQSSKSRLRNVEPMVRISPFPGLPLTSPEVQHMKERWGPLLARMGEQRQYVKPLPREDLRRHLLSDTVPLADWVRLLHGLATGEMSEGRWDSALELLDVALDALDEIRPTLTECDYCVWDGTIRGLSYKVMMSSGILPDVSIQWSADRILLMFLWDIRLRALQYCFYGDLASGTQVGFAQAQGQIGLWQRRNDNIDDYRVMERAQGYYCKIMGLKLQLFQDQLADRVGRDRYTPVLPRVQAQPLLPIPQVDSSY